jgi:hypothetical protein
MQRRWGKPGRRQAASVQTVVATVGRLDALSQNGDLDRLLRSGARFTESAILLSAVAKGETTTIDTKCIGPPTQPDAQGEALRMGKCGFIPAPDQTTAPTESGVDFTSTIETISTAGPWTLPDRSVDSTSGPFCSKMYDISLLRGLSRGLYQQTLIRTFK